jgi:hypothetical protein
MFPLEEGQDEKVMQKWILNSWVLMAGMDNLRISFKLEL